MTPNHPVEFISPSETYNREMVQAVQEAREWVLNWYDERARQTNPAIGKPYVTPEQLQTIHDRLAHVKVITGDDPDFQLLNHTMRSKLHVAEHTPTSYKESLKEWLTTHDEQVEELKAVRKEGQTQAGCYYPEFEETIISLNENRIRYSNMHSQTDSPYRLVGEIKQVAIHELTHAATYETGLYDDIQEITDRLPKHNTYWDSPVEIQARLNELRYEHGLTPDQNFTPEQVQQLHRESIFQDQRTHQKIDQSDPKGINSNGPHSFTVKAYDPDLFDRYTEADMQQLLNEVACTRPLEELDEEHRSAHPDRMSEHQLACQPQAKSSQHYTPGHGYHHRMG